MFSKEKHLLYQPAVAITTALSSVLMSCLQEDTETLEMA